MIGSESELTQDSDYDRILPQRGSPANRPGRRIRHSPTNSKRIMRTTRWFAGQHERWKPASIRIFRAALRQLILNCTQNSHINQRDIAHFELALQSGPIPKSGSAKKRLAHRKKRKECERDRDQTALQVSSGEGHANEPCAGEMAHRRCTFRLAARRRHSVECPSRMMPSSLRAQKRRTVAVSGKSERSGSKTIGCGRNWRNSLPNSTLWTSQVADLSTIHDRFLRKLLRRHVMRAESSGFRCTRCDIRLSQQQKSQWLRKRWQRSPATAASNTAFAHYARRRSGWHVKPAVAVSPVQVALVKGEFRPFDREPRTALTPS